MGRPTAVLADRGDGYVYWAGCRLFGQKWLLRQSQREMIRVALGANHGRLEAAAKALGIPRKGLYLKRQRLGL
jgi:DNA-binding NtrC family response regulator